MRKQLFILAGVLSCIFSFAQIVNIPDANFKAYLVGNPAINTNGDSEIQVSEAEAFTGAIKCYNRNIKDFTGIEAFINMTELDSGSRSSTNQNRIVTLDLSKNIQLKIINCSYNELTNLDVSKNLKLESLACLGNKLNQLNLINNTQLISLSCDSNFTTLDLTKNSSLLDLYILRNENSSLPELVSLDVSKNGLLEYLAIQWTSLTDLDVSKNTMLKFLWCSYGKLTNLNVSNNTALTDLYCFSNQLISLDVSKNTALTRLECSNNQLVKLNLKNGNNTLITNEKYNSLQNPNLTCIQVDDENYSNANWINKDSWASYSTNCSSTLSINQAQKLQARIYPNPVKNILNVQTEANLQKVEIYSSNGQLIKTSFLKEINVSTLPKGNYIVKITTDKGVQTEKFIKE